MARWPTWSQKLVTFNRLGYRPHAGQLPGHRSRARVLQAVGAERSGKSEFTEKEVVARLPWCKRVAIAAQEYDESRSEMGLLVADLEVLGALASSSTPQYGKWRAVTQQGTEIETISLHRGPEELTGTGLPYDIVALVEGGRIRYDSFLAATGRVSETDGLVLMSGTLWDTVGWYPDLYNELEAQPNEYDGERFTFPAWLNLAVYPGGREDPKIKRLERIYPKDDFDRLVAALLVASPGRVYPEFTFREHVEVVRLREDIPVHLAVDAGYYPSHYAVLALQVWEESFALAGQGVVRMEVVHQVDEVWEHHLTHEEVYYLCQEREWWGQAERVILGHEGKQHQAAASTQEVWQELAAAEGKELRVEVFDAGRILDGVARVRTFLRDPMTEQRRLVVGMDCVGTQGEFQKYGRRTDSRGNVVGDEPKDADNDAMDCWRNYLVWRYGLVERVARKPKRGRRRVAARG